MVSKKQWIEWRRIFWHGVFSGIGWAFGATIVFAILITLLGSVLAWLENVPVVGNIFRPVENIIEQRENPREQVIQQYDP